MQVRHAETIEYVSCWAECTGISNKVFQVIPDRDLINEARQLYAPVSHEVFQLVPAPIEAAALHAYNLLGRPLVSFSSIWHVYSELLQHLNDHRYHLSTLVFGQRDREDDGDAYSSGSDLFHMPLRSGIEELDAPLVGSLDTDTGGNSVLTSVIN